MIQSLKLNTKLLLFWFGSLISILLIIGFLFQFMLTELHQADAEKQINQAYSALQKRISNRMLQTQKLARHFTSRQEVIASLHLINDYEDINNYQAIIFDTEKSNLVQQLGRLIQVNELEHALLYDNEAKLTGLAEHKGNVISFMHSHYKEGKQTFMKSDLKNDDFIAVPVLPNKIQELKASFIKVDSTSRLISANGKIQIESIMAINEKVNGQNKTIGWIHFIDSLDNTFINNVLKRFNLEYKLALPDGGHIGTLADILGNTNNKNLPARLNFNSDTPAVLNVITGEKYFTSDALIPLKNGNHVLITIGAQTDSLVSVLNLFIRIMLFAFILIALILSPLGYIFLKGSITTPIGKLVDSVKLLGRQNTDQTIYNEGQDELSFLAASIKTMACAITEREKDLRDSNARTRLLLNSTAEAIYGIDTDGSCTFTNQSCLNMLGYENASDLLGKNMHDLIHHKYPDGTHYPVNECHIYRAFKQGKATNIDNEVLWRKDGSKFPAEYWSFPIFENNKITGAVVTFFDITERKENEAELQFHREHLEEQVEQRTHELTLARDQARQATKTKSLFLANMSHELRTPMNSIIGFTARVIKKAADKLNPRELKNLQTVERNAYHLLELINGLLDLSKIEAGKMDAHAESFDLPILVHEIFNLTQPILENKPVEFKTEIPSNCTKLYTDSVKLKQILINLVTNAVKFTHDGSITIAAQLLDEEGASTTPQIAISVIDTGVGMSKDDLQFIFEAFRQLDGNLNRKVGGTGLGLAIVSSFTELLGGKVTVESQEGVGTTFKIIFPVSLHGQENKINVQEKSLNLNHAEQTTKNTILCIDDENEVLELLSEYLIDENYHVITANTAEEGLTIAKQIKPFAITLDILMPQKDGWSVLNELKADKTTCNIPVIIVSFIENRTLGYQLGVFDYMQKPINQQRLVGSIERLSQDSIDTVLVVDDDPEARELMKQILDDANIDCNFAVDGEDALSTLERSDDSLPELILLDLMMPGMDGFELLEKIQENPDWVNIPVIIVTAKTLAEHERDYLHPRVASILAKDGLTSDKILEQLGKAMKQFKKSKEKL